MKLRESGDCVARRRRASSVERMISEVSDYQCSSSPMIEAPLSNRVFASESLKADTPLASLHVTSIVLSNELETLLI